MPNDPIGISESEETTLATKTKMAEKVSKPITLRRDGKGPLKFSGERIGDATRTRTVVDEHDTDKEYSFETSARLFRTPSGKYVAGIETYNTTDEEYVDREGWVAASLEELLKQIKGSFFRKSWINDDLLAELFEDTEIADQFVEKID